MILTIRTMTTPEKVMDILTTVHKNLEKLNKSLEKMNKDIYLPEGKRDLDIVH